MPDAMPLFEDSTGSHASRTWRNSRRAVGGRVSGVDAYVSTRRSSWNARNTLVEQAFARSPWVGGKKRIPKGKKP
jgi:hypothetical protein